MATDPFATTPNPFLSSSTALCIFCSTQVPTGKLEEHQKHCLTSNPFVGYSTTTPQSQTSLLVEDFFKDLTPAPATTTINPQPQNQTVNAVNNSVDQPSTSDQKKNPKKILLVDEDEKPKPDNEPPVPSTKDNLDPKPNLNASPTKEEVMPCPICSIPYPVVKIEAHVLACLDAPRDPQPQPKQPLNPNPNPVLIQPNPNANVIPNPGKQEVRQQLTASQTVDSALLEEQERIFAMLKKKKEQEEEDKRMALLLSKNNEVQAKAVVAIPKNKEDEELAKVLQKIEEEEIRKKKEADEKRDRDLAERLFQIEKEEEEKRKRQKEMDETMKLLKTEVRTELDAEMAKLLKEKEELLAQLQKAKQNANANAEVSISLEGVEYPEYWQFQKSDFQSFDVNEYTAEYDKVSSEFLKGMYNCKIVRIERIQNRTLWMWYYLKRQQVAALNKGDPNEVNLFHGSRNDAYDVILKEGLDIRVANLGGAIGAGVYFAYSSATSSGYVSGGKKMGCESNVILSCDLGLCWTWKARFTKTSRKIQRKTL